MSNKFSACLTSTLTAWRFAITSFFANDVRNSPFVTSPSPSISALWKTCNIFSKAAFSRLSFSASTSTSRCDACSNVFCTITATTTCMIANVVQKMNQMKKKAQLQCSTAKTLLVTADHPSNDITWRRVFMLRKSVPKYPFMSGSSRLALPKARVTRIAGTYVKNKIKSHAQASVRAAAKMPSMRNQSSLKKRSSRKMRANRASRKKRRSMMVWSVFPASTKRSKNASIMEAIASTASNTFQPSLKKTARSAKSRTQNSPTKATANKTCTMYQVPRSESSSQRCTSVSMPMNNALRTTRKDTKIENLRWRTICRAMCRNENESAIWGLQDARSDGFLLRCSSRMSSMIDLLLS
mmetsp:Transcript_75797/g.210461  ORF Transcript_75797/g.210461 Transcript_75797/m.210461 type:complete len:353 (-) Transcript_75797:180-1238(-)